MEKTETALYEKLYLENVFFSCKNFDLHTIGKYYFNILWSRNKILFHKFNRNFCFKHMNI